MNDYYVYCYLDTTNFEKHFSSIFSFVNQPFYVGMGRGNRCFDHLKKVLKKRKLGTFNEQKILKIVQSNNLPAIIKVSENLSRLEAIELEKTLISEIGTRKDVDGVKRGPLTNLTSGGDGIIGYDYSQRGEYNHSHNSGKLGIHNPATGTLLMVQKHQLADYEKDGWKKGFGDKVKSLGTENKIWINDGSSRKCITEAEIEKYKNNGWNVGYKINNDPCASSGFKMINKDGKNKSVHPSLLDQFLNDGWVLGIKRKIKQ